MNLWCRYYGLSPSGQTSLFDALMQWNRKWYRWIYAWESVVNKVYSWNRDEGKDYEIQSLLSLITLRVSDGCK